MASILIAFLIYIFARKSIYEYLALASGSKE